MAFRHLAAANVTDIDRRIRQIDAAVDAASLDLDLVLSNLGLAGDRVIQVITASVFYSLRRSRHRL
jgi:hypothetical protein